MPRLVPDNELEIARQYAHGEITATQAAERMGVGFPDVYRHMATRMLRAVRQKQAEFNLVKK